MTRILFLLAMLIAVNFSYAQTNTFPSSGNVGIGVSSLLSGATLQVVSHTENNGVLIGTGGGAGYPSFMGTNGLYVDGTFRARNYLIGSSGGLKWGASQARIIGVNPSTGSDTYLSFYTGGIAANGERMRIIDNGNVGIGTTDPKNHRLAVNGDIIATKVTVMPYSNWPDYVFNPQYDLPSLTEVKTYIDQNQHLPDMPSEQEVAKNGVDLGEMNKRLLKKIEELTLYLIEKDKEIDSQKKKDIELEARLSQLEELIKQ